MSEQLETTSILQQVLSEFGEPFEGKPYGGNRTNIWNVKITDERNSINVYPFISTLGDEVYIYAWDSSSTIYIGLLMDGTRHFLGELDRADFNHRVVGAIVSAYIQGVITIKEKVRQFVR
jgi:hypothetical protein